MAGDISTSWGIDHSAFRRGAAEVDAMARRAGAGVDAAARRASGSLAGLGGAAQGTARGLALMGAAGGALGVVAAGWRQAKADLDAYTRATVESRRESENAKAAAEGAAAARGAAWRVLLNDPTGAKTQGGIAGGVAGAALRAAGLGGVMDAAARDVASSRRTDQIRDQQERELGLTAMRFRQAGGPGGEVIARQYEEQQKHLKAMREFAAAPATPGRDDAIRAEKERHGLTLKGLEDERRARWEAFHLEGQRLKLDIRAAEIGLMKAGGREREAIELQHQLDIERALAELATKRSSFPDGASYNRRVEDTRTLGLQAMQSDLALFDRDRGRAAQAAKERVADAVEAARIEGLSLRRFQTEAELARTRLDYEQKIREVRRDDALDDGQRRRAEADLAASRDRLLREQADAAVRDAGQESMKAALRSGGARTLEAGLGSAGARQAVFGPAGAAAAPVYRGLETEVQRAAQRLAEAQKAQQELLRQIAANTARASGGAVVGGP